MAPRSRRVFKVAADLLALLGSAGSVVFGVLAGQGGTGYVRNLILAGCCAVVPVTVRMVGEYRAHQALLAAVQARDQAQASQRAAVAQATSAQIEAEARLIFALSARLSPILYYLSKIAARQPDAQTAEFLGRLVQAVVSTTIERRDSQAARRGAFFKLENGRMECDGYAGYEGNDDVRRTVFTNNRAANPLGRYLFQRLAAREAVLIPDVGAPEAPAIFPPDRSYESLIAAAVAAGETQYGILTLVASQANSLGESDLEMMKTLASLLGIGLALVPPPGTGSSMHAQ